MATTKSITVPHLVKIKRKVLRNNYQATVESKADVPRQLAKSFYGEVERLLGKLCSATHNNLTVGNTCRCVRKRLYRCKTENSDLTCLPAEPWSWGSAWAASCARRAGTRPPPPSTGVVSTFSGG